MIISSIVEGKEKLRLDQSAKMRQAPLLEAWPIVTGEAGIESDTSAIARCVEVQFQREENAIENLEVARKNEKYLPAVGYRWIEWLKSEEGKKSCATVEQFWPTIYRQWFDFARQNHVNNASALRPIYP